jgi:broad specificity phosphatase PhoE
VILLVRHGQTTSNAARLLVGRSDPPLTELGERQAIALRPLLTNVREVWSSPLRRATATATLAFPATPAVIKESFIELDYGTFDGKELSAMST